MEHVTSHEAFARLLIEHEPVFLRYILTKVPNRADAHDIVQECSAALWGKFEMYDSSRPFVGWALGFLRLEVLKFLRKSQRRAQLSERAVEVLMEQEAQDEQVEESVNRYLTFCLEQLPDQQRSIIDGYYYQEYTVEKLATQYDRTEQAIYKALQRIRASLQLCIEGQIQMSRS
ncbi:MAG: sigma-70 family RNA polymerase sigma factor [Verrucomicrobia bacterium]|jgi:RNA polymerase sigma-70 factor, ECF subfamily|nr:sigma-70 family RNA polymerase sigma factor [Verrucomicrobiota bacterium]MBT7911242.1 sigma-70 family RNA polymerase sigma factor [Verrucomicrobiota bacterium]